jgi:hypothetical protein
MSGLEVTLSAAVAVWAVCLLLADSRRGNMRRSLALAVLLPLARPDLLVIGAACVVWLLLRRDFRNAGVYLAALLAGLAIMSATYLVGWGRPLPSSYYAKVGGLRIGVKALAAVQELIIAGRALPFLAAALALIGPLAQWLCPTKAITQHKEAQWSAALLLGASSSYVLSLMLTVPWFGQEDRYLLPIHPLLIVQVGMVLWWLLNLVPSSAAGHTSSPPTLRYVVAGALVSLLLIASDYLWATRDYSVEVRNINDAHVLPALWLARNSPPDALVASEPIGAVRLFSNRRTIDLVGLTTPATLGTYRDWPRAWPALHQAGARYLLFYPAWFDKATPPPWAVERTRFFVADNRIAGDSFISVYELLWDRYTDAP